MEFSYRDRPVRVFAISPRAATPDQHWSDLLRVAALSQQFGCTGVLLFTGNDVFVEPWVAAQQLLALNDRITVLIAINPIYMHPFTAAKFVSSLSQLYRRRLYLNLVTGTAVNYLDNLGDRATHDERYERLLEFSTVIDRLLRSTQPVTAIGRYYHVSATQLLPGLPAHLLPEYFIAGQSDAALRVRRSLDAVGMQMLSPGLAEQLAPEARGIHFGVVTRPSDEQARAAAARLFPADEEGEDLLELSMRNTDSTWKRRLRAAADVPVDPNSVYSVVPFRQFQADCPYLIGSYERVSAVVSALVERGIDHFILDLPSDEEEFAHTHAMFAAATDRVRLAERV